jgi:hypothetical protein
MVSYTLWPLYLLRKRLRYPLDRRLCGAPEPVWTLWRREIIFFHLLGIEPLYSRLLSKNIKINIYKTLILPAVLYRCEI